MNEENREHEEKRNLVARRVRNMRHFYSHLLTFIFVNILLLAINLLTNPKNLWFYWVTVIWGIVLIYQAFNTFTIRNPIYGDEWEKKKIEELLKKEKEKK